MKTVYGSSVVITKYEQYMLLYMIWEESSRMEICGDIYEEKKSKHEIKQKAGNSGKLVNMGFVG
jgi:hypothetical protein